MKQVSVIVLTSFLLLTLGCASSDQQAEPEPAEAAPAEDIVAKAVEIAKEIEADPDATEEIFQRHGVTVDQFEDMMIEISADPEMTKRYEAGLAE